MNEMMHSFDDLDLREEALLSESDSTAGPTMWCTPNCPTYGPNSCGC